MPKLAATGVSEEEYQKAESKFIELPPGKDEVFLACEVHNFDWDTPGKSYKFEVTVTEDGPNLGKEDKISGGASPDSIWSTKKYHRAITGVDIPMETGHPTPDSDMIVGKACIGKWVKKKGHKGGKPDGEIVTYVKLEDILPMTKSPVPEQNPEA